MTTIVWGHGERDRGEEKTFVPQGVTVKWWSEVDKKLFTPNGFLAIETGAFGNPTDRQGPGNGTEVEVYNYSVFPSPEDEHLVRLLNEKTPQNKLKFVGTEVPEGQLCNSVADCKSNGTHKCDGVFGKATLEWKDPELVLLHCRGLDDSDDSDVDSDDDDHITMRFGGKSDDPLADTGEAIDKIVNDLLVQILKNPEGAEKTFDDFPERSKVYALPWDSVSGWLAVRWASDYGRKGDIPALFKQLEEQLNNDEAEEYLTVPRYADGLTAAARSKPQEFFERLDSTDGTLLDKIAVIPGVLAARQTLESHLAAKAQFTSESWAPDDGAKRAVQTKNRENLPDDGTAPVYAGGVVMLIGGGHNPRVEAYVDRQADRETGSLIATKGGPFKVIKVLGITRNKTTVEGLLKEISDKKVKFE